MTAVLLKSGAHASPSEGLCVMEAAAWLAGEAHTDHPACVSVVIAAFCRSWNDALPTDADRQRLLAPLLPALVGTATTAEDEETRAWMATDWLARVCAPAWLRLAGLEDHARALEALARIVDPITAGAAQPTLDASRKASAAAWDAAWDAARAAAWDAARDAARAAAWAAARAAARAAAWAAARDAARAAAWDAARAAATQRLAPTVAALQESAVALLRAMADVGRVDVPVIPERLAAIATGEGRDDAR